MELRFKELFGKTELAFLLAVVVLSFLIDALAETLIHATICLSILSYFLALPIIEYISPIIT